MDYGAPVIWDRAGGSGEIGRLREGKNELWNPRSRMEDGCGGRGESVREFA